MPAVETELRCRQCGSTSTVTTETTRCDGAKQLRVTCAQCETFIKFATRDRDPVIYFGRYKGLLASELPREYLQWVVAKVRMSSGQRRLFQAELDRRE